MSASGTKLTLQLLQGPTAALVSSAVAGAAAGVCLTLPAQCASYNLVPYDDDVFQSRNSPYSGTPPARQRSLPKAAAVVVKPTKLQRPIGWVALSRIAGPRNVLVTLARNEALSCVLVLHGYFEALSAEEDLAELQGREPDHVPFPAEAMKVAARRGFFNACLDWATQVVRALLDWAAARQLSPSLAGKLVKDLKASVARKAQYSFPYRGLRVVKTSLLSEATLYLADYIVAVSVECYAAVMWQKGPGPARARRLARRAALHSLRCSMVLATVSVANGAGSMSPFKRGLCMFALSQLSSLAVNATMYPLIERLSGDGVPPPAGGTAGAEAVVAGGAAAAVDGAAAVGGGGAAAPVPPAVGEPLLMMNAQMPRGAAAAAAAEAMLQAGVAAAGAGVVPAAAGVAAGQQQQQQQQQQQRAAAAGQDVGVQADEPPVPPPQERRPVAGMGGAQRLPERPHRRNQGMGGVFAPPPQAPQTPQFREARPPSPAPDSEDAEAAAARGASPATAAGPAAAAAVVAAGAGSSSSSSSAPAAVAEPAAAVPAAPAAAQEVQQRLPGEVDGVAVLGES